MEIFNNTTKVVKAGFRFIFTSPIFIAKSTPKERREFYIPRLHREKSHCKGVRGVDGAESAISLEYDP